MNLDKPPCVICGNSAGLMCQRCGESYCNDVCQRKDWQRHKYFCTIMPPLVTFKTLKPTAVIRRDSFAAPVNVAARPLETPGLGSGMDSLLQDFSMVKLSNNNKETLGSTVCPNPVTLSALWREHEMPPKNEFFECRVTYMEMDGPIWVLTEANAERLERLTTNIARSLQQKFPCSIQDLSVGDLVGTSVDNKMYRGEVIGLEPKLDCAEMRLIDYGMVKKMKAQDIYLPVPRMADIKALAFRVKLPTNTGVQVNMNLALRLLGCQTPDGIEQAQLKPKMTIPLDLPLELLVTDPAVSVIKIFKHNEALGEPQVALLQIKKMTNLNDELNERISNMSDSQFVGPFPEEVRTFFLAARTEQGYRRAFLLDYIEQPSLFLVYEMDEGRISIANEVRRIPSELLIHSLRVFAVTLTDDKVQSLQQRIKQSGRDLSIKFKRDSLQEQDKEKLRKAYATLLARNEQVCSVRAHTFVGRAAHVGLKYWREPVENGSMVYITHIASYQEICVSSIKTKQYDEIFKLLESKCKPFEQSADIPVGIIVLVMCPNRGHYRAEVTGSENNRYAVHNIDTGSVHRVPANWLRMPCGFLENLPVSQCRSKIKTICNIPSSAVPQNTVGLQLLTKLYEEKAEMAVEFSDAECETLDLLNIFGESQSLMTRMLPLMFTPTAIELEPAQSLPAAKLETAHNLPAVEQVAAAPEPVKASQLKPIPTASLPPLPLSPPTSPTPGSSSSKRVGRHYYDDLERLVMPLGDKIQILVLNAVDLSKTGYVTACSFATEKESNNFQTIINMMPKWGSSNKTPTGYAPEVGEMCLAMFSEDESWYRGVCLEIQDEKALILYFDFGNSEVVSLDHIKPIPRDALRAVCANKCFVDGFNTSKNFSVLEKYLTTKNKILCAVLEGPEPGTRLIKIPNLDKILSKQIV